MGQRYFQNTMVIGPELDGDDVDSVILKAAAAALKVGGGYFALGAPSSCIIRLLNTQPVEGTPIEVMLKPVS
jgi:hypothetical protein